MLEDEVIDRITALAEHVNQCGGILSREDGGDLDEVLRRLARAQDECERLRGELRALAAYGWRPMSDLLLDGRQVLAVWGVQTATVVWANQELDVSQYRVWSEIPPIVARNALEDCDDG